MHIYTIGQWSLQEWISPVKKWEWKIKGKFWSAAGRD